MKNYHGNNPWTVVRLVRETMGRGWFNVAASIDPLTGPTLTISKARSHPYALADWRSVATHARLSSATRARVDTEWLSAMFWYADSVSLTPNYWHAKVHADPRVRALAARDNSRYGQVIAPYIPWEALETAPHCGRWDEARWVSLLHRPA